MINGRDPMKAGCQTPCVSLGAYHLNAPPENVMPKKATDYPTGLRQRRGSWFQYFYDADRVPPTKGVKLRASTYSRALIARGKVITAFEAGTLDPWQEKAADVTLQEAFAEYLETKASLAPNSLISKRTAIRLFLDSIPSKRRPAQVQPNDFRLFFNRLGGKASSQKTRLRQSTGNLGVIPV